MGCTTACIDKAKRRIKLTAPDVRPINSVPYSAGRQTPDFDKVEFEKMLRMNIKEPAQAEWRSPIEFAPKRPFDRVMY